MSTTSKKVIGKMSLADMLSAAELDTANDLPTRGGPYDTIVGWRERLGISTRDFTNLCKWLGDACEKRRGYAMRVTGKYRCTLIYSTVLEEKAKERGGKL